MVQQKGGIEKITNDGKESEADIISTNSARALFNFLRSNEEKKHGKTYIPCLFLPDESIFFTPGNTLFSKVIKNKIYKNHGIHRAKSYVNMIFQDKKVCKKIDECIDKFSKKEETDLIVLDMLQIPEFHYILTMAMIFDIIYTLGYKLDLIFTREFENLATGNYTFVLEQ